MNNERTTQRDASEQHAAPTTQEASEKKKPAAETEPANAAPPGGGSTATMKKALIGGVVVAAVFILLFLGFGSYWMVYQYAGDNPVKDFLKNTLPFPVAIVNGQWVPLAQFEDSVSATDYFFGQQDPAELGLTERPALSEIRDNQYDRYVNLALLEQLAEERGVTVSQEEVDEYFTNQILPQAQGGIEEVETTLRDFYDWSVDEFKEKVLYEVVLAQKVEESLAADEGTNGEAKQKADELYQEIMNSEKPFSEFATEYSDDTVSAQNGGMLGFFGRGMMVPEFEDAAFSLDVGQVSEPVKTQFGYHIIKVTDKDEEAGTVEARHILISTKSLTEIIQERLSEASVRDLRPNYE